MSSQTVKVCVFFVLKLNVNHAWDLGQGITQTPLETFLSPLGPMSLNNEDYETKQGFSSKKRSGVIQRDSDQQLLKGGIGMVHDTESFGYGCQNRNIRHI